MSLIQDVEAIVAPLWPLEDYVAVNPFLGLVDQPFVEARQILRSLRDCDLLMPLKYFQSRFEDGKLQESDISAALDECRESYPEFYAGVELAAVIRRLREHDLLGESDAPAYRTVATAVDEKLGSNWSSHIVNDVSRHLGAYFDEGQAVWPSPWKGKSLYDAWRGAARLSRRMDMLGMVGFHDLVDRLPDTPTAALAMLLAELGTPSTHALSFLRCELLSVAGWASYIQYRVRQAKVEGHRDDDLVGLLAIRLAYDVGLAQLPQLTAPLHLYPRADSFGWSAQRNHSVPPRDVLYRHVLQVAAEVAYRRSLLNALGRNHCSTSFTDDAPRKAVQMVFCIDVRSEVMRRHLEAVSPAIETFGFAGFFGLALEYVPLGAEQGTAQCPVLLTPGFRIRETLQGADEKAENESIQRRATIRQHRKIWKSFQTSAASCFSFVEALGLTYFGKLLTDSLGWTRPVALSDQDGLSAGGNDQLGPELNVCGLTGISPEKQIDLAAGMLKNLGLTTSFARLIVVCGHGADVVNNPYKAGLDCGACGGHSGEANARVAAALLNDAAVRRGLADRGIPVPLDTWFLAGVHNTTTDEIRFYDDHLLPATHQSDYQQLQYWVEAAGGRVRGERCLRLGNVSSDALLRRGLNWSEVRPEWGLAGNAAFVVAPRELTQGLELAGRTFLHNYSHLNDPDGKVLELIMTAPMIVTSWINLQYYASTVDNRAFGSGSKVIHNVVGRLGVFQGNGGDLMTGLPWQSVHDGRDYQHEPLRLLVVIQAPRSMVQAVIEKHESVRHLVEHGWISLVVLDEGEFYQWTSQAMWVERPVNPSAESNHKNHVTVAC